MLRPALEWQCRKHSKRKSKDGSRANDCLNPYARIHTQPNTGAKVRLSLCTEERQGETKKKGGGMHSEKDEGSKHRYPQGCTARFPTSRYAAAGPWTCAAAPHFKSPFSKRPRVGDEVRPGGEVPYPVLVRVLANQNHSLGTSPILKSDLCFFFSVRPSVLSFAY